MNRQETWEGVAAIARIFMGLFCSLLWMKRDEGMKWVGGGGGLGRKKQVEEGWERFCGGPTLLDVLPRIGGCWWMDQPLG